MAVRLVYLSVSQPSHGRELHDPDALPIRFASCYCFLYLYASLDLHLPGYYSKKVEKRHEPTDDSQR